MTRNYPGSSLRNYDKPTRLLAVFGLLLLLWFALLPVDAHSGDRVTYIHTDLLGSPVAASDESGSLVWRKRYLPYGGERGQSQFSKDSIGYTGHLFDNQTEISYFQARSYDPVLGRFLGIDAVGVLEENIHSFNRFAYANNNPYRYADPDGNQGRSIDELVEVHIAPDNSIGPRGGLRGRSGSSNGHGGKIAKSDLHGRELSRRQNPDTVSAGPSALQKSNPNQTGSYTNLHASGKTYVGKGSRKRSQVSGRREAKRNNDPHVATDWTPARNNREAFKQESRRLDAEGGPGSPQNYNRIEQPGKKYRFQDGEY